MIIIYVIVCLDFSGILFAHTRDINRCTYNPPKQYVKIAWHPRNRRQIMTRTNDDHDPWRHIASLSYKIKYCACFFPPFLGVVMCGVVGVVVVVVGVCVWGWVCVGVGVCVCGGGGGGGVAGQGISELRLHKATIPFDILIQNLFR